MGSARAYVTALNKLISYIESQQVRRQEDEECLRLAYWRYSAGMQVLVC